MSFHKCGKRFAIAILDNLLLINTYLSKITNDTELSIVQAVLDDISSAISLHPDLMIVWGGDFNINSSILINVINANL